jgi:hypothetical protein
MSRMVLPPEPLKPNPFDHSAGVIVTVNILFVSVRVTTRDVKGAPQFEVPSKIRKLGVALSVGQFGILVVEPFCELPVSGFRTPNTGREAANRSRKKAKPRRAFLLTNGTQIHLRFWIRTRNVPKAPWRVVIV